MSTRSTICAASIAISVWKHVPTEAITETKLFEFSFTNRQSTPSTPKTNLLVGDDGTAQEDLPWEDCAPDGEDVNDLRLDACHLHLLASAEHEEGRVHWSGELGYGIRAPEVGKGRRLNSS